jgi:hypothetical protein
VHRADDFLYGRYNEGAIAPLLLAGFAVLATSEVAALQRRYVAVAGGAMLASGAIFFAVVGAARLHETYFLVTVLGIDPIRRRIGWPDPSLIAAATFTLIYLVAAVRRFGAIVPIVMVGVVFVAFAVKNTRDYFQPESLARGQEHVLADAIARIDATAPVTCVAYDRTTESFYHHYNYQLLSPAPLATFVPGRTPPCGDLVISNDGFGRFDPGARIVARETRAKQTLWVLPGARQEELAAAGALLP